jgi:ABC-type uncharacterized transport system permease subunit
MILGGRVGIDIWEGVGGVRNWIPAFAGMTGLLWDRGEGRINI